MGRDRLARELKELRGQLRVVREWLEELEWKHAVLTLKLCERGGCDD